MANQRSPKNWLIHGLTTPLRYVARFQTWVSTNVQRIPGWPEIEAAATQVTWPLRTLAAWAVIRMPWLVKYEWLFETQRLAKFPPVMLALTLLFMAYRGLSTTNLGHIGTDSLIYPSLALVSGFNPFLGGVSALVFGAGDIIQKLLVNDIYGTPQDWVGHYFNIDYWGSVVGYVFGYSALLCMGLLPGISSRLARQGVRLALRRIFYKQAAAAADGAQPFGQWRMFARRRSDGTVEWTTAASAPGDNWVAQGPPMAKEEADATLAGLRSGELVGEPEFPASPVSRDLSISQTEPRKIISRDLSITRDEPREIVSRDLSIRREEPRKIVSRDRVYADDDQRGEPAPPSAPPGMFFAGYREDGSPMYGMTKSVAAPPPAPAGTFHAGYRDDGSQIVGMAMGAGGARTSAPQGPVAVNYKDPDTLDALRGLRDKGLLNDPDAWRTYVDANGQGLSAREKHILGNLRGRRLLKEGNEGVIDEILEKGPQPRVPAIDGELPPNLPPPPRQHLGGFMTGEDGGATYPLAEFIASLLAGGLTTGAIMQAIAPYLEIIPFYSRLNPDVSCYALEKKILQDAAGSTAVTGGMGGTVAETIGKPVNGGPFSGGGAAPPSFIPNPTREQEEEFKKRWNAVDPYALQGNRQLQDDYKEIMDRFEAGGGIDQEKLSEIERQAGILGDQKREEWNKDVAEGRERTRETRTQTHAAADDAFEKQKDLSEKLDDTLRRINDGSLQSAKGLGLDPTKVYNPDGTINEDRLNEFVNSAKGARRSLVEEQTELSRAVADTQNVIGTVAQIGETTARVTRNVAVTSIGGILTGGAGVAAGGGIVGAGVSGAVGTAYGTAAGAFKAASDNYDVNKSVTDNINDKTFAEKVKQGAKEGAIGGAIGGTVGGVIAIAGHGAGALGGEIVSRFGDRAVVQFGASAVDTLGKLIGNNPSLSGAYFGAVGAKVMGGNPWEGALEGAAGGKFSDIGGRTVGDSGWTKGFTRNPVQWGDAPDVPVSSITGTQGGGGVRTKPTADFSDDAASIGGNRPAGGTKPAADAPDVDPRVFKGQKGDKSIKEILDEPVPGASQKPPAQADAPDVDPRVVKGQKGDKSIQEILDEPATGSSQKPPTQADAPDAPASKAPRDKPIQDRIDESGPDTRPDTERTQYGKKTAKEIADEAREEAIAKLAKEKPEDLSKQLTEAELLTQDKEQADLIRDAMKRQRGETKPPVADIPEDPRIRQAELDKLEGMSRDELETRKQIADIEGDKKTSDLMKDALNRNTEPSRTTAPFDREKSVKDLSKLDMDDLEAMQDAARKAGNAKDVEMYGDAMKTKLDADTLAEARDIAQKTGNTEAADSYQKAIDRQKDVFSDDIRDAAKQRADALKRATPEELSEKYTNTQLKEREAMFRADGDEANAQKMADAAKLKPASIEELKIQKQRALDAGDTAAAADADAAIKGKIYRPGDEERLKDLEKRVGDYNASRRGEPPAGIVERGSDTPASSTSDQGMKTIPPEASGGVKRPVAPADPDPGTPRVERGGVDRAPDTSDQGIKTVPPESGGGVKRPPVTAEPEPSAPPRVEHGGADRAPDTSDQGIKTVPPESGGGVKRPPVAADPDPGAPPRVEHGGADRAPDTSDQGIKTVPPESGGGVKRPPVAAEPAPTPGARTDTPEVETPWGKVGGSSTDAPPAVPPGHPSTPPDVEIPPSTTGRPPADLGDVAPTPPRKGLRPEDLPEGDAPFTSDQQNNLRNPSKYSDQELLDAREQARKVKDIYQERQIEQALDDRGFRAPVDENLVKAPPHGELPDMKQISDLGDRYTSGQLQEMENAARARGTDADKKLADILNNARMHKGDRIRYEPPPPIDVPSTPPGPRAVVPDAPDVRPPVPSDRPPDPVMPWDRPGSAPPPSGPRVPPAADAPEIETPWGKVGGSSTDAPPAVPPGHPSTPPDVEIPQGAKGRPPADLGDVAPAPPRKGLRAEDLPEGDAPFTSDQQNNLRNPSKYSDQELLDAREQARKVKDVYQERQIEQALDDRGYRAPIDENLVKAPPPNELPDMKQVSDLSDRYTSGQLQEMENAARARGTDADKKLADILNNARMHKGDRIRYEPPPDLDVPPSPSGPRVDVPDAPPQTTATPTDRAPEPRMPWDDPAPPSGPGRSGVTPPADAPEVETPWGKVGGAKSEGTAAASSMPRDVEPGPIDAEPGAGRTPAKTDVSDPHASTTNRSDTPEPAAADSPSPVKTAVDPMERNPDLRTTEQDREDFKKMFGKDRYDDYAQKIDAARADAPELANIPTEDLAALRGYTEIDYQEINAALRSGNPAALDAYNPEIKSAVSALNQLPPHQGTVFRGTKLPPEVAAQYQPGEIVTERGFTSTTYGNVKKFEGETVFTIHSKTGRDVSKISEYDDELEVLFAPGTKFRVLDHTETNGQRSIILEEV